MRFHLRGHNYPYSDNPLSVWYVHSLAAHALLAIGKRGWSHKTQNIWKNGRKFFFFRNVLDVMYKIYAKVAAMDVMRQGLRLYQHRAAPHPQLPLYLYRATHQYSQHTFFCQLLKKRESYFPYSYFLFVFRFKKNKIDLDIPVNDWCDQGHNSWFADKIELGNSRVWVEPVVQLTDADFCKIFNRESQLRREEGGDSPFWKVKEDFEDLGFRLFGLADTSARHTSLFSLPNHTQVLIIILRHWQFHNFSALADSLDQSDCVTIFHRSPLCKHFLRDLWQMLFGPRGRPLVECAVKWDWFYRRVILTQVQCMA